MTFHLEESDMKNRIRLSMVLLMTVALSVMAVPSRPVPQRLVNDYADLFTWEEKAHLEQALVAFDDSTSNQITVVTVNDLEGYEPAEYATRIGLDWQVGSADFDNGVVVLVKPKTDDSDGQVFIAVGYGLEGAIPDAYAKRIIENEMIPHFREGDYFGGVAQACVTLMQLASGEISEPRDGDSGDDLPALIAFLVMVGAFVLIVAVAGGKNNGRGGGRGRTEIDAADVISTVLTYGSLLGRGGGGHSHGGFGGGSFGGGFGGFGGGSFGGGGAGGSW